MDLTRTCLKAMFESSRTYGLFTAYFDEELYHSAQASGDTNYIIGIIGVTRALEDVEISQRNHSSYQYLERFLEQDFATIHSDEINIPDNFKYHLTARIDIQLISTEGDFQILSCSDNKATILKTNWNQKNVVGYIIQSFTGNLKIVVKATKDGQIKLLLRGMWINDPKDRSKRIPYWIDYTKLMVNEETIFDNLTSTWCSEPYRYKMDAKADEEIKIQVEWQPHRSDT